MGKSRSNDVDLDWVSPGLRCSVQVQFVIGNDGSPRGIGGAFETKFLKVGMQSYSGAFDSMTISDVSLSTTRIPCPPV